MDLQQQSAQAKTLRVQCRQCKGIGLVVAPTNPPALGVCGLCNGQKEILVREHDPSWSLDIQTGPNSKRTVLAVTWGGEVMHAPPLTKDEILFTAKSDNPLIAGVVILASENANLRRRLLECERRLNISGED